MKFKEAMALMSKLGDYTALNFPIKPLKPYEDLLFRNFVLREIDPVAYHEHCSNNKGRTPKEIDETYSGDFTIEVVFANDPYKPSIEKLPIPYKIFIDLNGWNI